MTWARTSGLVVCWLASAAVAAPPPGHPSAEEAVGLLGVPSSPVLPGQALPYAGIVRSARDSNAFTFIEVEYSAANGSPAARWIAAPLMEIRPGDRIRFDDGRTMTNFFSRKHQITFESITFVGRAVRDLPSRP